MDAGLRRSKLNLHVVGHAFAEHWLLVPFLLFTLYLPGGHHLLALEYLEQRPGVRDLAIAKRFSLYMIGLLFSVVIPGSVGGDLMKAYYVGTRVPNRRAHALPATILMDRYLGLLSLLYTGGCGGLLELPHHPDQQDHDHARYVRGPGIHWRHSP